VRQRVAAQTNGQTVSFRQTVRQLSSAQKTVAPGAPPYSIYINRRIGRYVAAAAYRAGWSANAVSWMGALLTFSGILLLATAPTAWWVGILVWLSLAIGYVFDSADGQVARLNGGGSPAGEWLDHVLDSAKLSSLHLAVLITAYVNFNFMNDAWLLIPLLFSIVASVSFFSMILNDHLKAIYSRVSRRNSGPKGRSVVKSILLLPTDYGVLCLLFVLIGDPILFSTFYTLFFLANAGHLFLASRKWFGDMKKLEPAITKKPLGERL
jgi:phosphatidylglycerophosphate synthase